MTASQITPAAGLPTRPAAGGQPRPWQDDALCAQVDPHLFHPDTGDSALVRQAKRVCGRCPVRRRCLDHALTHGETRGVWGGLTAGERKALQRLATEAGREAAA